MPSTRTPTRPYTGSAPDWRRISRLVAADDTVGSALLDDDPALGGAGWAGPAGRADGAGPAGPATPRPVLLIEPVDPLLVRDPAHGPFFDLHVDLLVRRGCDRFRVGAPPPPPAGWSLVAGRGWFELRDADGHPWAYPRASAADHWWLAAHRAGTVVVLCGAWLGVRSPRGVPAEQFGPAQRAAELRAGAGHGLVAVTTAVWQP